MADQELEAFRRARWLAVYGASVALQASRMKSDHGREPDQADVDYFSRQAAKLADMVNGNDGIVRYVLEEEHAPAPICNALPIGACNLNCTCRCHNAAKAETLRRAHGDAAAEAFLARFKASQ